MPTIKVNGVDRSSSYRPEELAALEIRQIAFDGEVGQGSIPIPDPAGTYEVYAGQRLLIEDGAQVLIDGFVGATTRNRGEGAIGPRRMVGHTLLDENARFQGFRAYQWTRGAETTRARFLAFLAAFVPAVTDTTWVLSTNVANMPKKTYTTENLFDELKQEIADLTGNTAFIEGGRAHLHLPTEGFVSTLAISDSAFDFASAFPPDAATGPTRDKDPYELGNDVMVRTPQGSTTLTDATSITRHDAGGLKHQRLVELDSGDSASRTAKATAILAESKNERITYECDIGPLTAAQVNLIPPGCLINVTSQVMGLSSSTQRVAARTLSYHHPGKYLAHIELGYPIRKRVKPPRTTNPVAEANAVITVENGGLEAGAALTGLQWYKKTVDYINGDQGWVGVPSPIIGTWLPTNDAWPGTPCGVSLGAWRGWSRQYAALTGTAPADSDWIALRAAVTVNGLDHGTEGFLAGTIAAIHGPVVVAGGLTGGVPAAGDIDASGSIAGGMGQAQLGQGITAGSGDVDVSRNAVPWGSAFRLLFAPGWFLTSEYICVQDDTSTNSANCGAVGLTATLTPHKLSSGAYGWLTAAPKGTQNGVNTTFTAIGGYTHVSDVIKNGISIPADAWRAADGATIQTIGWAPLATDNLQARYYVPK